MVGAHLLGEIADRTRLSSGYSAAIPWTGERAPGQDRGRLFAQVAVMLAAGGRSVADMAALRDQPELFGDVASPATIWRAVHQVDQPILHAPDLQTVTRFVEALPLLADPHTPVDPRFTA
jgi:hypothetical protein